jgi:predicted nucleic acid-binding protein
LKTKVVDASAILAAYLPDEPCRPAALELLNAYTQDQIKLFAPSLLIYEIGHALLRAARAGRITLDDALEAGGHIADLQIPLTTISRNLIKLAWDYQRSAYDAAYLALAQKEGVELITGDKRLYNAVKDRLPWVKWVENYQPVEREGEEGKKG